MSESLFETQEISEMELEKLYQQWLADQSSQEVFIPFEERFNTPEDIVIVP